MSASGLMSALAIWPTQRKLGRITPGTAMCDERKGGTYPIVCPGIRVGAGTVRMTRAVVCVSCHCEYWQHEWHIHTNGISTISSGHQPKQAEWPLRHLDPTTPNFHITQVMITGDPTTGTATWHTFTTQPF